MSGAQEAGEALAAEVAALERLYDASMRLWRLDDLRSGLDAILDAAISLLGADMATVQLFDPRADATFAPFRDVAGGAGFRAVHSTPLAARSGEPLGVLSAHFRRSNTPAAHDLRRLDLYLCQAADFIERQRAKAASCERESRSLALLAEASAARAEAESANRAKDEFLATLSHELRTPLAAILLWAGALRSGAVPLANAARAIDAIVQSAESQSRLIEDLLDLSRLASGKLTLSISPTDVTEIVREAVEMVSPLMTGKQLDLEVDTGTTSGLLAVDGKRLRQILGNLLSNSIKLTAAGRIRLHVRKSQGQLVVEVSDTGEGIEPDLIPRLFEPFWQVDMRETRRHMGLGIGLALAKKLVTLHGGTIEAQSDGLGRGALFRFRIPWVELAPETADTRPTNDAQANAQPLAGVTVLLVENDEHALEAMKCALRSAGATVLPAASAAEALAALAGGRKVDVLVSDLGLPDMSGYSLIEQVTENYRRLGRMPPPSCAVSGYARDIDRQRAITAGFDMYLSKPAGGSQLIEAVKDLRDILRAEEPPFP